MLYAHEVVLNELAQGDAPLADGVEWFERLSEGDQREVLRTLVSPPAVMLTKWRFGMAALPVHELTKSFRLLVALFGVADTRRRELYCAGGCAHAWHNLPGGRGAAS
ncbi:hypothetical protein GCM10023100_19350 [Actinocorallia cavernae]|uniref:Uncharacterized protein n=2 Tax=Actinomycetes TaxID=1760 RepID=A0ABP5XWB1_9ACTN